MGSTVVLVFESPELKFNVKPGDKVKMGESIASFVSENFKNSNNEKSPKIEEIVE